MVFNYDINKSEANKKKHGIDFEEAKALWLDEVLELPAKLFWEKRWMVIGKIKDTLWTAIVTRRKENNIRIISVRRSNKKERMLYEEAK